MATKGERARAEAQRTGRAAAQADGSTTRRRRRGDTTADAAGAETGRRNLSRGGKASFAFESARVPAPPSRKSTRRSKNRQKAGVTLKAKRTLEVSAPRSQHDRGR